MTLGRIAHPPETGFRSHGRNCFLTLKRFLVFAKAMKPWLLDSDTISVPADLSVNLLLGRDLLRVICTFVIPAM